MKRFVIAILFFLFFLIPNLTHAADVYLPAGWIQSADLSGNALRDSAVYVTAEVYADVIFFVDNTACATFHHTILSEYTAAANATARLVWYPLLSTGTSTFQASVGCVDTAENFRSVALTAGTASSLASGSVNKLKFQTTATNFMNMSTCSPNDEIVIKLCRTDVNTHLVVLRRFDYTF